MALIRFCTITIFCLNHFIAAAQSFDEAKKSAINYIKRVYNASPFEGAKKIEGETENYYAVTVSYLNAEADIITSKTSEATKKAQASAEEGFAEPAVKFEMVDVLQTGNRSTFLFLCETLSSFLQRELQKKSFDGARIISAPSNKYIVAVVNLENSKYSTTESRDKVAHMKAKQMVNSLINGSTISSEVVIRTDETDSSTEVNSTEFIREQAMGFIQGLELLSSSELQSGKTSYLFYSKIQ
jgi:hypothetical protein